MRIGTPFAELIAACRELGDELLVVGARKRASLTDLLLGSTAERVLRKATRAGAAGAARAAGAAGDASSRRPTSPRHRGRRSSEAIALARRWGARLVLLHVIEPIVQAYAWATDLAGGEIYVIEPARAAAGMGRPDRQPGR